MLSPSEYDHLTDRISELYARLDRSIVEDMARRIARTGMVTESTKQQAERLQQAGLLYEDVIADIAKITDASESMLRGLFEDAGVQSIRNDNRFYRAAGLEGIVKMSDAALQTLNAGFVKCLGSLQNLTRTTAVTAQTAYLDACDLAYMQVSTGTMDYQTAIRRAVQSAAEDGSTVLYPSGHKDQLDVAVRRAVLTGFGQTARKLSEINADDMGCDLMEITAHAGARPSHAEWQGQIVSRSGRRGYLSKSDIGYGTGDGFGGWNCRHDWYPFFEGISRRAYTEERLKELNEKCIEIDGKKYTDYEVSQMQRALERDIRKQKRTVAGFHAAMEAADTEELAKAVQESFAAASVKLKEAERELQDFLKQTGFLLDSSRVWVNGFGKSVSQKAVWAAKKKDISINWLTAVGKDGKIDLQVFSQALASGQVNTTIDTKQQVKHQLTPQWKNQVKQAIQNNGKPKSRLRNSVNPQDIVDKFGGKGTMRVFKGNYCVDEFVTLPFIAGVTFDKKVGKYIPTRRVQIKYTKTGTHVIPVLEKE